MEDLVAPALIDFATQALRDIGDGFVIFWMPGLTQEVEVPRRLFRPARTEQREPYAQALVLEDRSLMLEVAGDRSLGGSVDVPEPVARRLRELGFGLSTTDTWNNPNFQLYVDDAEQGGAIMAAALAAWGVRGPADVVLTGER